MSDPLETGGTACVSLCGVGRSNDSVRTELADSGLRDNTLTNKPDEPESRLKMGRAVTAPAASAATNKLGALTIVCKLMNEVVES